MKQYRLAAIFFGIVGSSVAAGTPITPVGAGRYSAEQADQIAGAIGASTAVSLGESIHLTREMPSARLELIRLLHERKGFNALAFEGALMDAWTAQEKIYQNRSRADAARSFTRDALFGLWQTNQMEQVVGYALATQHTNQPIYLSSFDIQPGMARSYGGSAQESLQAFLDTARAKDPTLASVATTRLSTAIGPALNCRGQMPPEQSLGQLDRIVESLARHLRGQRPELHLAVLGLVPTMVRMRLEHCSRVAGGGDYQRLRDEYNAQLAMKILDSSGKLMIWAHHSHIHHNSLGRSIPSMGQHLKEQLGDKLYTVGVFAAAGDAVDSVRADRADGLGVVLALASRNLPTDRRFEVERRLAALSPTDFFLDLRSNKSAYAQPSTSRLEVDGQMPTALSRDFDGAILLHRVSGAELNFLPRPMRVMISGSGWVLRNISLSIGLLLLIVLSAAYLWQRRSTRSS